MGGEGGLGNLFQLPGLDSEMTAHESTSCRRPHSTFFCKRKMFICFLFARKPKIKSLPVLTHPNNTSWLKFIKLINNSSSQNKSNHYREGGLEM